MACADLCLLLPELHLRAIHQLVPVLSPGDAVSDCALLFRRIFHGWGLRSEIFAESVAGKSDGYTLDQLPKELPEETGVLLHHSIGSTVADKFIDMSAELKILFFQNITPPALLRSRPDLASRAVLGLQQLQSLVRASDKILTASGFSADTLPQFGPKPIVVPLAVSGERADQLLKTAAQRKADAVAPLFLHVGRVVPHKAAEDIIRVFSIIQKSLPDARLAFVGADDQVPAYARALHTLIDRLKIRNVSFYGQVEAEELIRFFAEADVYLCAGRHEGFCVPPMECMFAELPVIAFAQPAVVETVGSAGVIIEDRDHFLMAETALKLISQDHLRATLRKSQAVRREIFTETALATRLRKALTSGA